MSHDPVKLASQLHRELLLLDEIEAKVAATKKNLLQALMANPSLPRPYKTEWGQIQLVNKLVWAFRDGAVTAHKKAVDKLRTELDVANKLLKGAEEAAKVAGKASVQSDTWSLRVVRGDN